MLTPIICGCGKARHDMTQDMTQNKTRIALIGCGAWGKHIARNLAELGVLAAICDTDSVAVKAIAQSLTTPMLPLADIEADASIHGVAIATPASSHAELADRFLTAGKHVYIEKPFALSLAEAEHLAATAKQANTHLMVGHLLRYHPAFLALQAEVAKGRIGRVTHISAMRLASGRVRAGESVLYDLTSHDLAMVYALTHDNGVGETVTHLACHSIRHIADTETDIISATLQLKNRVSVHLHASWMHPVKIHTLTVIGDTGALVFDDTKPWTEKLRLYRNPVPPLDALPDVAGESIAVAEGEPLRLEMLAFITTITDNAPPPTDIKEALYVQRLLTELEAQATTHANTKPNASNRRIAHAEV